MKYHAGRVPRTLPLSPGWLSLSGGRVESGGAGIFSARDRAGEHGHSLAAVARTDLRLISVNNSSGAIDD